MPILHDNIIIFRKLFVSILDAIAGAINAAAKSVTPIELIDVITTPARINENNISTRSVFTPYT